MSKLIKVVLWANIIQLYFFYYCNMNKNDISGLDQFINLCEFRVIHYKIGILY